MKKSQDLKKDIGIMKIDVKKSWTEPTVVFHPLLNSIEIIQIFEKEQQA